MVTKQNSESVGAFKPGENSLDGGLRTALLPIRLLQKVSDDLSVSVRGKDRTCINQFGAQRLKVFNDAIVNDDDIVARMWVGILFRWRSMCCPTCMANANHSSQRFNI